MQQQLKYSRRVGCFEEAKRQADGICRYIDWEENDGESIGKSEHPETALRRSQSDAHGLLLTELNDERPGEVVSFSAEVDRIKESASNCKYQGIPVDWRTRWERIIQIDYPAEVRVKDANVKRWEIKLNKLKVKVKRREVVLCRRWPLWKLPYRSKKIIKLDGLYYGALSLT
jgi:hypothetical protein